MKWLTSQRLTFIAQAFISFTLGLSLAVFTMAYWVKKELYIQAPSILANPSSQKISLNRRSIERFFSPRSSREERPLTESNQEQPNSLTLLGTTIGSNISLATLQTSQGVRMLSSGEIADGWRVLTIDKNAILVQNSEGERLTLHTGSQQKSNSPASTPLKKSFKGSPSSTLSMSELRDMIDNPGDYEGRFRIHLVRRDGQAFGISVRFSDTTHPFYRMGIRSNDIITSLNGQPLRGPEDLQKAYRILRNTADLRFEIERSGKQESIEVHLSN